MQNFDFAALLRMVLVYLHLLAFAAAAVGVALGDIALFSRKAIDSSRLQQAGRVVTAALLCLWATGLMLVAVDTGMALDQIAARPKLLAKLTVVIVLSLNGMALHRWVFPALSGPQPGLVATRLARLGTVSMVSWLYAVFLGVSGMLAPMLGYSGYLALYGVAVGVGLVMAGKIVGSHLRRRWEAPDATGPMPLDGLDASDALAEAAR